MKKIIILVAVVVVVAVVFGSGLVSVSSVHGWVRNVFFRGRGEVHRALTERELGNVEHAQICRANLRLLESGKRKAASEKGVAIGTMTWKDVLGAVELREMPKCPDGGEYHLNDLQRVVSCTIGGNGTVDKEDDHTIYNY